MTYWGFRIDTRSSDLRKYLYKEIEDGRLRQGWGYSEAQDLRKNPADAGARKNLSMYNKVKQGDIILIPRIPEWGEVLMVRATEDWNKAYTFSISPEWKDYGHIFPVEEIKAFNRGNNNVDGCIRYTLGARNRFWKIKGCSEAIEKLISSGEELRKKDDIVSSFTDTISEVFSDIFSKEKLSEFGKAVGEKLNAAEWERALVFGLQKAFPYYEVIHTGGKAEKNHGTDILIKMPALLPGKFYGIAIQVKDWNGALSEAPIKQINRAETYWESSNIKIIERVVLATNVTHQENNNFVRAHTDTDTDISFILKEDLEQLLLKMGLAIYEPDPVDNANE